VRQIIGQDRTPNDVSADGHREVPVSVSVDGYLAGPNQTLDNPLGVGGEALLDWMVQLEVCAPRGGRRRPGEREHADRR
jgi:hypothetical protein